MNCLACNYSAESRTSLSQHVRMRHQISAEEYYQRFVGLTFPTCVCGKSKKFGGIAVGYSRVCYDCRPLLSAGSKRSEETKRKMSASMKGRPLSEKHVQSLIEAFKMRDISGPKNYQWNPDREEQRRRNQASRMYYGLIGRVLSRTGKKKEGHTEEIIGYSYKQLRERLESLFVDGMSWENQGRGGWHIDHIRPINTFPLDAHPREVNALSNLRPLWEHENLSRPKTWSKS